MLSILPDPTPKRRFCDERSICAVLLAAGLLAAGSNVACSQTRAPERTLRSKLLKKAESEEPPPNPTIVRVRLPGDFPTVPFFRGSSPTNLGDAGFYVNLWGLVNLLALTGLWVWSVQWVDRDSRNWNLDRERWNRLVMAGGLAGVLVALSVPMLSAGLVLFVVLYVAPLSAYIVQRNSRVPETQRVLTPRHLQMLVLRTLARAGMGAGSKELRAEADGPPIVFVTKSRVSGGTSREPHARDLEKSPAYRAAKELIYDALTRRVSDVHLEPTADEVLARYRIDGIMYQAQSYGATIGHALLNIYKILAAMDITERRRPQDGSFQAECEQREIDFRVATQGTSNGEKMSLRVLDKTSSIANLSELGLRRHLQGHIRAVVEQPHGLFLSCGPTGAGKSTTLRAALAELDPQAQNIITVEDPVEYKLEGVTQIEINTKAGQTFSGSLRSVLRQDPDVILIGEIRDGETASIACQAANTGHMVFSTVHANDTITALHRLIELGAEPFVVANSISAVLGQRLVRRLCEQCKEPHDPDPEVLREHRIPSGKVNKFYRPPHGPAAACESCGGLGYRGRIGVFELLVINDKIRELIRGDMSLSKIKAAARRDGMMTMKEEGLRLVLLGTTTMDELLRVVK